MPLFVFAIADEHFAARAFNLEAETFLGVSMSAPLFIYVDVYHINVANVTHIEETPEGTIVIYLVNDREIFLPSSAKQELERALAGLGASSS